MGKRQPDIYDRAIEDLVRTPASMLWPIWQRSDRYPGRGRLFDCATRSRTIVHLPDGGQIGDPLMIRRGGNFIVEDCPHLAAQIAVDSSVPAGIFELARPWDSHEAHIRRKILQPLADWQRILDEQIPGRVPPEVYDASLPV